jgi:hypothetical protein
MVAINSADIHEAYGVDLRGLSESCSHVLVGVVTQSGVIWRGEEDRQPPPGEEWLVEMLRSRGEEECLFLQVDGASRAALQAHCQQCPAGVKTYWFPRNRCSCLMLREESATA